jgi:hypothetical protein
MDAVDLQAIQKFVDVPFVVEAPLTASAYAARSAAVLAKARVKINTDSMGDVPYRNVLNSIRKQVAAEFDATDDRIEFFDLGTKDLKKEAARIDKSLVKEARDLPAEAAERGAITFGVMSHQMKPICVVVGPGPGMTVTDFFKSDIRGGIDTSGISDENVQQLVMWHELGHCLLGMSENKADTFAALMSIRHGHNEKLLPLLATWREFDEWSKPEYEGDYFISKTLWNVIEIEPQLLKSKKFMSMSVKEIASLADEVSDKFALTKDQIEHMRRFRTALAAVFEMKAHYIKVDDGMKRVDPQEWMYSIPDVPEFARFSTLIDNLRFGAVSLKPFEPDAKAFKITMKEVAAGGDRSARTLVAQYEKKHVAKKESPTPPGMDPFGPRIGFRAKPAHAIDEIISVNKSAERINFSFNNDVWVVRDKETGSILRAGSSSLGQQWGAKGYDPLSESTDKMSAGR